jgi:hypothetical protein
VVYLSATVRSLFGQPTVAAGRRSAASSMITHSRGGSGHRDDWLAARLDELDAGDIAALLTAGRRLEFTGRAS